MSLNLKIKCISFVPKKSMTLFVEQVPNAWLYAFLDNLCTKTETHYCLNHLAYQKMMYLNQQEEFLEKIKPYYLDTKKFYCERKMTFHSFVNMIRQICKNNDIEFFSKLAFDHSQHQTLYYIGFKPK